MNNNQENKTLKQECIDFADWIARGFYVPWDTFEGITWDQIPSDGPDIEIGTTEQLYELYLSETRG